MKWISISEKLPEKAGDYLVHCFWKNYKEEHYIEIEHYTKKGGWENFKEVITHWMSLPEYP